jgi:lysophospholipase L1-like esterase
MPEPQTYTTNFAWRIVRKALSRLDVRDWFAEQTTFANDIDATVKVVKDTADVAAAAVAAGMGIGDQVTIIGGGTVADPLVAVQQDLQSVLETGSTATIETDIEVAVEKDAPLSGINNPIHVHERIRNTATLGVTEKAVQMRRRAEGTGGTSYAESNQTASESDSARDFISDIAAVDVQTARVRCRVVNGEAQIVESAQVKNVALNGDQTVALEKDLLLGTVTDTETVKNIGVGATLLDESGASKIVIVESDNNGTGEGPLGRVTVRQEASNIAGGSSSSEFSIDFFSGGIEKTVVSSGDDEGETFHEIEADRVTLNGTQIEIETQVNGIEVYPTIGTTETVYGPELVVNPTFESGVTGWLAQSGAVLSWREGGLMRIAYGGTNDPYATQSPLAAGQQYIAELRVRSGGTMTPRLIDLMSVVWTGTTATTWQRATVIFTAAGAGVAFQGVGSSGYIEVDLISVRKVLTANITDRSLTESVYQNALRYSEDLSNAAWVTTATNKLPGVGFFSPIRKLDGALVEYQAIAATAVSAMHTIEQTFTDIGVPSVFRMALRPGRSTWAFISVSAPVFQGFYFDLVNAVVGTKSAITDADIRVSKIGFDVLLSVKFTGSTGSKVLQIAPAFGDALINVTGDGVTPELYLAAPQVYSGAVGDGTRYATSVSTAIASRQVFCSTLDQRQKWDSGLLQRTDAQRGKGSADGWEVPTPTGSYFPTMSIDETLTGNGVSTSYGVAKEVIACLGDSITDGLNNGYPERLNAVFPYRNMINYGVSGASTAQMIANDTLTTELVQLLPAIGRLYWDFKSALLFPFTAINSAVLSIASSKLRVTQGAAASPSAQLRIMNVGQRVKISGTAYGDGTAAPSVVSSAYGALWTGTSSTGAQTFSVYLTSTVYGEGIQFAVTGGSAANYIEVAGLTIELNTMPSPKPSTLIAMSGVNDIADLTTLADIKTHQDFISRQAQQQGIRAVWMNITPVDAYGFTAPQKADIKALNEWQYGGSLADAVIDTSALGDINHELLADYDSGDHLHPNVAGYAFLGEIVKAEYFMQPTFTDDKTRSAKGYAQLSSIVSGDVSGWEIPQNSTSATQYQYRATPADIGRYGVNVRMMKFGALSDGDTLATATAIHGGSVTVSNGTNRITLPLNYTDGTNTVSIFLSGTTGSGTITASITGYTVISGCVVYS